MCARDFPKILSRLAVTSEPIFYYFRACVSVTTLATPGRGDNLKILVAWNRLGDENTTILCDALRESKVTNVQ